MSRMHRMERLNMVRSRKCRTDKKTVNIRLTCISVLCAHDKRHSQHRNLSTASTLLRANSVYAQMLDATLLTLLLEKNWNLKCNYLLVGIRSSISFNMVSSGYRDTANRCISTELAQNTSRSLRAQRARTEFHLFMQIKAHKMLHGCKI